MKRFCLVYLVILFLMPMLTAQDPQWDWVRTLHTGDSEIATAVALDPESGGVYLAGEWRGSFVDVIPVGVTESTDFSATFGGVDGLVVKLNDAGEIIWAFKVGGDSDDRIHDIHVDNTGYFYICGAVGTGSSVFTGTGPVNADYEFINPGQDKAFLAKFDPDGMPVWVRFAGEDEHSAAYGIASNREAVFMTGLHQGTISFGMLPPYSSMGGNDIFIVRYTFDGAEEWHISAGSDEDDMGKTITCDETGLVVGGSFSGAFLDYRDISGEVVSATINTAEGQADGFVASFATDGVHQWSRVIASTAADQCRGVALGGDLIFLAGTIEQEAMFPLYSANPVPFSGGIDGFVCALGRADGATKWVRTLSGDADGDQVVEDLAMDGSGRLYVTGYYTTSVSTTDAVLNDSKGMEDVFLVSYSRSGTENWIKTAGGAGSDVGRAVCAGPAGSLFLAGWYGESAAFGSEILPADGNENIFLAKLQLKCIDAVGGHLTAPDTVIAEGEATTLVLKDHHGDIRWETSLPGENNWTLLTAELRDSIQVFPGGTADYRAFLTSGDCAPDSSNVVRVYIVNTNTRFAYAGEDRWICRGDSTQLKASGGAFYKWDPPDGLDTTDVPDPWAKPPVTTTYIVFVTRDDGFTDSDTVTISVHPRPSVDAGPDLNACQGDRVELSAQGEGTITWHPLNLFTDPTLSDQVVIVDQSITFGVVVTDANGCRGYDEVYVHVKSPPVADAGQDQVFTAQFEIRMTASLKSWEWGVWNVESGSGVFEDPQQPDTKVTGLEFGENIFSWTVSNGFCPDTRDLVKITIRDFLVPTVITPNGDGRNDYFHVSGIVGFESSELVVLNRWGEEVYRDSPYLNDWNGVDQTGDELPNDTYYVVLRFDSEKTWKGYLELIR